MPALQHKTLAKWACFSHSLLQQKTEEECADGDNAIKQEQHTDDVATESTAKHDYDVLSSTTNVNNSCGNGTGSIDTTSTTSTATNATATPVMMPKPIAAITQTQQEVTATSWCAATALNNSIAAS